MTRRAWGSGSLYRRKSDGRWVGSVELQDDSGARHRRYVTGTTKSAVRKRLRALAASSASRRQTSETVGEFMTRWLDDVAAKRLRPRTMDGYRSIAVDWIIPAIGDIPLGSLGPDDVQRLLGSVPRSAQTVGHVRKVLSAALQQALRWELVDRNVARLVPAPRITRQSIEAWTADEARTFLAFVADDDRRALYVLAITTGMRQGELLGLRWQDVDLERGTLRIERTVRQIVGERGAWAEEEPKTKNSRRTIPLSKMATAALEAMPRTLGYVFARPDGQPLNRGEVTRRFQRTAKEAGLRRIRFHGMRHTAAVLMLDASGGDLRMTQAMLGHSSIQTTVDVYGGRAMAARERAASLMDEALEAER